MPKSRNMSGGADICLVLVAIFLPPIAVLLDRGCGADFFINIVLTLLGHIPGVIHALFLILYRRERRHNVSQGQRELPQPHHNHQHHQNQTNEQAMYGKDLKHQHQQPVNGAYNTNNAAGDYYDGQQQHMHQPQAVPPPMHGDYTEQDIAGTGPPMREKHEYVPPTVPQNQHDYVSPAVPQNQHLNQNQGYGVKEI